MRYDNWLEAINVAREAAGYSPVTEASEGTTIVRDKESRAIVAVVSVWDDSDKYPYLVRWSN